MVDRNGETESGKALALERGARQQLLRAQEVGKFGSWEVDLERNVLTWSDMVFRIFEIDRADFAGTEEAFFAFIHPDDVEAFHLARESWLERGGPFLLEHRIVTPSGKVKWVVERAELIANDAGVPIYTTGTVQDITDLKTAVLSREDALRALERQTALVRMAGEVGHIGGWRYDVATNRIEWTDETARIHGEPPGTSPSVADGIGYYVPADRPRIERLFRECLETGAKYDGVFRLRTRTGREVIARSIGEPEFDAEGRITAVRGAFQDITKLVEAQTEAANRNAELSATMAAIADGFLTLDRGSRIRFVNDVGASYLGQSQEALIGQNLWKAVPAARSTDLEARYKDLRRDGRRQRTSSSFHLAGRNFEATLHSTPGGMAIQFRDVTEEDARRKRLELLETAIDRIGDMVVITEARQIDEPHGPRIIYVNRAFEDVTGYCQDEVVGRTPRILQGQDTSPDERARIRDALAHLQPVHAELINYRKSGARYWAELDIAPLLSPTGEPSHFVAVQRDITKRKRDEARIRESEERFRLISRASSDVIWDWDIQTGHFWLSENYEEVFGHDISREPQTFDASIARIHPEDQDRIRTSLEQAIRGSDEIWTAEYRVRNVSGGYSIVEDKAFIIRDDKGKPLRMVAGMSDVTQYRSLDEQLKQSQKLEAIGQLTGGVAHDFNNLLTIVLGNVDMLEEEKLEPKVRKRLDTMAHAAERGAELTRSLLAFARRQPLAPEATNVDALLRRSRQLLRQGASEDIEIEFDLRSAPSKAMIDPAQLQSAVLNLVLNAAQAINATGQPGRITIMTERTALEGDGMDTSDEVLPGDYVLIAVSDTGIGMREEEVKRAFEPFFTTRQHGSGLGLSSVYGFLRQSGGHARIASEVDIGTTVSLYLPVAVGHERSGSLAVANSDAAIPTGNGEHVLLVEDEENLRTSVGTLVETLGYRVTITANGAEALDILSEDSTVELLFTDVILTGDMNGRDLARAAQRFRSDLKVLFTSGYSQDAIIHGGQLDADVLLLSKPYRRNDLARALREALDRRQD